MITNTLLGEDQPERDCSGHFKMFHVAAVAAGRAEEAADPAEQPAARNICPAVFPFYVTVGFSHLQNQGIVVVGRDL